jgi:hypothetical protein
MAATYEEFAEQQRAEHLHPVTRWGAVIGWHGLTTAAAVAALSGRVKTGAVLAGLGQVVIAAAHLAEGNLWEQTLVVYRHPVWAGRADVAIANETIMGLVRRR